MADLAELVVGEPVELPERSVVRLGEDSTAFEMARTDFPVLIGLLTSEDPKKWHAKFPTFCAKLDRRVLEGLCTRLFHVAKGLHTPGARGNRGRSPGLRSSKDSARDGSVTSEREPAGSPESRGRSETRRSVRASVSDVDFSQWNSPMARTEGGPLPPVFARLSQLDVDPSRLAELHKLSAQHQAQLERADVAREAVARRSSVGRSASAHAREVFENSLRSDESPAPARRASSARKVSIAPDEDPGEVFERLYSASKEQRVRTRTREEIQLLAHDERMAQECTFEPNRARREARGSLAPEHRHDGARASVRLHTDAAARLQTLAHAQESLDASFQDAAVPNADRRGRSATAMQSERDARSARSHKPPLRKAPVRNASTGIHQRLHNQSAAQREKMEELREKHHQKICPFRPNTAVSKASLRDASMRKSMSASALSSRSVSASRERPLSARQPERRAPLSDRCAEPNGAAPTATQVAATLNSARRAAELLLESLESGEPKVVTGMVPQEDLPVFDPPPR